MSHTHFFCFFLLRCHVCNNALVWTKFKISTNRPKINRFKNQKQEMKKLWIGCCRRPHTHTHTQIPREKKTPQKHTQHFCQFIPLLFCVMISVFGAVSRHFRNF
jgi:hypothetical protein